MDAWRLTTSAAISPYVPEFLIVVSTFPDTDDAATVKNRCLVADNKLKIGLGKPTDTILGNDRNFCSDIVRACVSPIPGSIGNSTLPYKRCR